MSLKSTLSSLATRLGMRTNVPQKVEGNLIPGQPIEVQPGATPPLTETSENPNLPIAQMGDATILPEIKREELETQPLQPEAQQPQKGGGEKQLG